MRIGIDCRTLLNPQSGERAGVGHYTFHLVRALLELDRRNEYVLFFDRAMPHEVAEGFRRARVSIRYFPFSPYRRYLPFTYSHLLTAAALRRERLDIFHAPANVMPLMYPGRTVITIHDLAIYHHPEWFPRQPLSTKLLVPQSLRRARHIIAVSEMTKKDLTLILNVPAEKITVVPEAADTEMIDVSDKSDDIRKFYGLPRNYLLYVGTIEPRKNVAMLLRSWRQLIRQRPALQRHTTLVMAGGAGPKSEPTFQALRAMQKRSQVRYLGYVSHNHKILLLRSAAAFVFPSLYEGFGLPVLEAMQLGVPVITSATSSLPEVTGRAALLVHPENEGELREAMRRVLSDATLRRRLISAGRRRAKSFSWAQAAAATLRVYRNTA